MPSMAKILCYEEAIKITTHDPLYRKHIISLQRRTHDWGNAQWHNSNNSNNCQHNEYNLSAKPLFICDIISLILQL
jgi:hypothetical protein